MTTPQLHRGTITGCPDFTVVTRFRIFAEFRDHGAVNGFNDAVLEFLDEVGEPAAQASA